jgi:energy-coupling factor transporter transmembrane protein EcfT
METRAKNIFNTRKRGFIVWIVFALLIFISLFFLIWFSFTKIKDGSKDLFSERTKIALLKKQTIDIEDFKNKYGDYATNLQKIDQAFVDPNNPLKFIEFLEQSAGKVSVDLKISPLSFSEENGLKVLSLQLNSTGNFSDTLNFLEKIEKGPYLIYVQKIILSEFRDSKSSTKTSTKKTQANISIKVQAS